VKLSSLPEIGSDGDVLLTPYVPKGIRGYDDDDDEMTPFCLLINIAVLISYRHLFFFQYSLALLCLSVARRGPLNNIGNLSVT